MYTLYHIIFPLSVKDRTLAAYLEASAVPAKKRASYA